jgi:hypothetical protein
MVPLYCLTNSTVEYPYVKTNGGIWFEPYTAGVIASRLMEWRILTNEVVLYEQIINAGNMKSSNLILRLDYMANEWIPKTTCASNYVAVGAASAAAAFVLSTALWLGVLLRR